MELKLWNKALVLYNESLKRNENLSRVKMSKLLEVNEQVARNIIFALQNKNIIQYQPSVFDSSDENILVFGDVHIPYQDDLAIEAMLSFAEKENISSIIILGDLVDFYQISTFEKNPKYRSIPEEIKLAKKFLIDLKKRFKCEIILKEGNHEYRLKRYLLKNAKEIYELVENILEEKLCAGIVDYRPGFFRIGKLWVLHGHEKPTGSYNPEYICNVIWRVVHDHFIVAHYHRTQEKVFKNISGNSFNTAAIGYLAGDLDYAPLNKWNQGFAIVGFNKKGYFRIRNYKIDNGIVY